MAHYALLDSNNIVTRVILGNSESDTSENWELFYANLHNQACKRTSYNTFAGVHSEGGIPFRKNYAGIGYTYDSVRDAFIPPKIFPSWVLDESTCLWQYPVDPPSDYTTTPYKWNEVTQEWESIN